MAEARRAVRSGREAQEAHAAREIVERVRLRVRGEVVESDAVSALARDEVRRYAEAGLAGRHPSVTDEPELERRVVAALTGLGPLQPYLDDPSVEELWVNDPQRVFVARAGVAELTPVILAPEQLRDLVERMLATSGRRVDLSSPFVDATLPDGSRLHVVIPDVSRAWSVNIRKFDRRFRDLGSLVASGSLTRQAAEFLRMSVLAGLNVLISGPTASGKTTLLGALMAAGRRTDRIVTVEETFELEIAARDVVGMQCRQPSLEGTGEITLRRLVKEALRMRPDRLVVGEVRDAEALDLLLALNSGIPGACSIHANSAADALAKLCMLPLLAGRNIDAAFVQPAVASALDLVVFCSLDRAGRRRVTEVAAVSGVVGASGVETVPLLSVRDGVLEATGLMPPRLGKFAACGFDPAVVLRPEAHVAVESA